MDAMAEAHSPETIVQRQLDAYNARDVEALLRVYSGNAEMFEFPSTLVASGTDALRDRFSVRFKEPNIHAKLLSRTIAGRIVVDHEEVTRTFPEGPGKLQLIMIYEVNDSQIVRAWTIVGTKTLEADI
jgi:hypothetical protein